jgi:hypothetical protein
VLSRAVIVPKVRLAAFQVKVAEMAPVFDEPIPTPDVAQAATANTARARTGSLILTQFLVLLVRGHANPIIDDLGSVMADASG